MRGKRLADCIEALIGAHLWPALEHATAAAAATAAMAAGGGAGQTAAVDVGVTAAAERVAGRRAQQRSVSLSTQWRYARLCTPAVQVRGLVRCEQSASLA